MTSSSLFLPSASITLPVTPEALPNFHELMQLMLGLILFLPFTSISPQVTPEALPNFHRHIQYDKTWPLMEGMTMNLENAPISAGGTGQFPDPNAINAMYPSANIHCPLDHSGSHAQLPEAHSAIANP